MCSPRAWSSAALSESSTTRCRGWSGPLTDGSWLRREDLRSVWVFNALGACRVACDTCDQCKARHNRSQAFLCSSRIMSDCRKAKQQGPSATVSRNAGEWVASHGQSQLLAESPENHLSFLNSLSRLGLTAGMNRQKGMNTSGCRKFEKGQLMCCQCFKARRIIWLEVGCKNWKRATVILRLSCGTFTLQLLHLGCQQQQGSDSCEILEKRVVISVALIFPRSPKRTVLIVGNPSLTQHSKKQVQNRTSHAAHWLW